ncbi:MAG: hypothetical protein AAGA84_07115 [Pseudomonadota bacterium]
MTQHPKSVVLSQDYELFFQDSGSIEACLIRPCDWLLAFAREHDARMTFFVDIGMVDCMRAFQSVPAVRKMYDVVCAHIEALGKAGHEIALHIHPHWEESRWSDNGWDFSGARYRLDQFATDQAQDIVRRYGQLLQQLTDQPLQSYRAGGFCIEPFEIIKPELARLGIFTDSSIVPGACLKDNEKGFDFRYVPDSAYWFFEDSPRREVAAGEFLEIPVSTTTLPFFHYWQRMFERLTRRKPPAGEAAQGVSKRLGSKEIIRRLLGAGRVSELSVDGPKAPQLTSQEHDQTFAPFCQVMGHPKLVTPAALQHFGAFLDHYAVERVVAIDTLAQEIRSVANTATTPADAAA